MLPVDDAVTPVTVQRDEVARMVSIWTSWVIRCPHRRQKARLGIPGAREPRSAYWGPRLALEAHEQRLRSLDAAGRNAPACGRVDPTFQAGYTDVRYELASAAGADCVPLVRVRRDLIDRKRPLTEVQVMTIWFAGNRCGDLWSSGEARPNLRGSCP